MCLSNAGSGEWLALPSGRRRLLAELKSTQRMAVSYCQSALSRVMDFLLSSTAAQADNNRLDTSNRVNARME